MVLISDSAMSEGAMIIISSRLSPISQDVLIIPIPSDALFMITLLCLILILPSKKGGCIDMNDLQSIVSMLLNDLKNKLKPSTYQNRQAYFKQLLNLANHMKVSEPCQKLFDAFANDDHGPKNGAQCIYTF